MTDATRGRSSLGIALTALVAASAFVSCVRAPGTAQDSVADTQLRQTSLPPLSSLSVPPPLSARLDLIAGSAPGNPAWSAGDELWITEDGKAVGVSLTVQFSTPVGSRVTWQLLGCAGDLPLSDEVGLVRLGYAIESDVVLWLAPGEANAGSETECRAHHD